MIGGKWEIRLEFDRHEMDENTVVVGVPNHSQLTEYLRRLGDGLEEVCQVSDSD